MPNKLKHHRVLSNKIDKIEVNSGLAIHIFIAMMLKITQAVIKSAYAL